MTQRTVRFLGFAADTDANLVVSFDGLSYVGPAQAVAPMPADGPVISTSEILFTFDIDISVSGNIPTSITVQSGTVFFGDIEANYANLLVQTGIINGVYYPNLMLYPGNLAQEVETHNIVGLTNWYYSSGPNVFVRINGLTASDETHGDPRWDHVYIDGVLQVVERPPLGAWVYRINEGSTLTCNVEVQAGRPVTNT